MQEVVLCRRRLPTGGARWGMRSLCSLLVLATAAASMPSTQVDAARSLIAVNANPGHPFLSKTPAFSARSSWTLHWSVDCTMRPNGHAGSMLFIVAHGQQITFPYQYWIDLYRSPVVPATSGTYHFGHPGYYRLWVRVPSRCAWAVRVVG